MIDRHRILFAAWKGSVEETVVVVSFDLLAWGHEWTGEQLARELVDTACARIERIAGRRPGLTELVIDAIWLPDQIDLRRHRALQVAHMNPGSRTSEGSTQLESPEISWASPQDQWRLAGRPGRSYDPRDLEIRGGQIVEKREPYTGISAYLR